MSDEVKRVVYTITHDFARYRNLDILTDASETKVTKDMETNGYFRINATHTIPRGARKDVIILVLDENKKYSHNSPELKKLMGNLDTEEPYKNNTLDEVILVVADPFKSKKNLLDVVKMYQAREVRNSDPTGRSPFYNIIYYCNLQRCIPEHVGVPKHELLTVEEMQELCDTQYKRPKEFSWIPSVDPQILWIGGRPGQMVRIIRDSDTTVRSVTYRFIT